MRRLEFIQPKYMSSFSELIAIIEQKQVSALPSLIKYYTYKFKIAAIINLSKERYMINDYLKQEDLT